MLTSTNVDGYVYFKATSWLTNEDITDAHISATTQHILTKFSAVVTECQIKANWYISAHLHMGNYVNQVHHTTIRGKVVK